MAACRRKARTISVTFYMREYAVLTKSDAAGTMSPGVPYDGPLAGRRPGPVSRAQCRRVCSGPVRVFIQDHSQGRVLRFAAQLGTKGRHKMSEDEVLPGISRLAPDLR
jgi:hypothetical protein